MTVYVVINQPDLDWDHMATFVGVFATPDEAWAAGRAVDRKLADIEVYKVEVGQAIKYGDAKALPNPNE